MTPHSTPWHPIKFNPSPTAWHRTKAAVQTRDGGVHARPLGTATGGAGTAATHRQASSTPCNTPGGVPCPRISFAPTHTHASHAAHAILALLGASQSNIEVREAGSTVRTPFNALHGNQLRDLSGGVGDLPLCRRAGCWSGGAGGRVRGARGGRHGPGSRPGRRRATGKPGRHIPLCLACLGVEIVDSSICSMHLLPQR